MIGDMRASTKWAVRAVLVLFLIGGAALLVVAARTPGAPTSWWILGGIGALLGGGFVFEWVRFRIRFPTPEAREAERQRFIAAHRPQIELLERGRLARRAVREKAAILRGGEEASAVVTLLADAEQSSEFPHLVYLELEVTPRFGPSYVVKTGEHLTPASIGAVAPGRELVVKVDPRDRARVAVDWDASLRVRRPTA
ncbi:MAG TPA: hypothetical protein VEB43_06220 [Anaeromyxobacter sp.]|nr:hypothetical protein [Anaeromyxobacter sp.]